MAEFTTTVSNEDAPVNKMVVPELTCFCPSPLLHPQQTAVATLLQKTLSHPAAALPGTSGTMFPYSPTCPSSSSCLLDISPWSLRALLAPERCLGPGLMTVVLLFRVALY